MNDIVIPISADLAKAGSHGEPIAVIRSKHSMSNPLVVPWEVTILMPCWPLQLLGNNGDIEEQSRLKNLA